MPGSQSIQKNGTHIDAHDGCRDVNGQGCLLKSCPGKLSPDDCNSSESPWIVVFLLSFLRAEERDPDGLQDQRWGGGDFCTAACGSAAHHAVALARFKTFDGRSEPLTSFTDSLMFWSNAFVIVMSSFVISNLKFAMRLRLLKKQEVYGMDGWLANGIGSLAANSRTVTGVLELMYVRMTVHVCCF